MRQKQREVMYFFLLNGTQALTSWELHTHCWVLGLRFSGFFIARQGQLQLFYTKEFQRIIICFFLVIELLKTFLFLM